MKRKSVFIFAIVLSLLCMLCSCNVRRSYNYMNDKEDIVEISLVSLHFAFNDVIEYTNNVKEIDDIEKFLNDFEKLECYQWFGDPLGFWEENGDEGMIVIKFVYSNGDYELVGWDACARYTTEKGLGNHNGFRIFEEEQFNEFIQENIGK